LQGPVGFRVLSKDALEGSVRSRIVASILASAGFVALLAPSAPALGPASVSDLALPAQAYSHFSQTSFGSTTLTATDASAVSLGWNVTIQSSAFVYSGSFSGTNIPAANLSLTSAAAPAVVSGQPIDTLGVGGPKVPAVSPVGTLDIPRKTLQAEALFGKGTYTQALGVTLTIPAQSIAGTYTATLTTTILQGP